MQTIQNKQQAGISGKQSNRQNRQKVKTKEPEEHSEMQGKHIQDFAMNDRINRVYIELTKSRQCLLGNVVHVRVIINTRRVPTGGYQGHCSW